MLVESISNYRGFTNNLIVNSDMSSSAFSWFLDYTVDSVPKLFRVIKIID